MFIRDTLLIEPNYTYFGRNAFLHAYAPRGLFLDVRDLHNDILVDYFVSGYPVLLEKIDNLDVMSTEVVRSTSALMFTPLYYRLGSYTLVDIPLLFSGRKNTTPIKRLHECVNDLLKVGCVSTVDIEGVGDIIL